MERTKYSHLTQGELLRHVSASRLASPVIDELCIRLERTVPVPVTLDVESRTECPVCEAELKMACTDSVLKLWVSE